MISSYTCTYSYALRLRVGGDSGWPSSEPSSSLFGIKASSLPEILPVTIIVLEKWRPWCCLELAVGIGVLGQVLLVLENLPLRADASVREPRATTSMLPVAPRMTGHHMSGSCESILLGDETDLKAECLLWGD